MKKSLFLVFVFYLWCLSCVYAEICPPVEICPSAPVPGNPAPIYKLSDEDCLIKINEVMDNGQIKREKVELKAKQGYWVAASGCSRVQEITIFISDEQGEILEKKTGRTPAFCFVAPSDGAYIFSVKISTYSGSSWGNVDSCFSKSECDTKKK